MHSQASLIDELESRLKSGTKSERANILKRVTDLFLLNANDATEAQVEVFDEVMIRLIEKIEDQILAQLSERLAAVDNSPINVITQLSRHERIEVAGPVLEKSNRLTDIDLVEIAYTKSQAHLIAIAGRKSINPMVAEALIRRGTSEVALKVAANAGAAFSSSGFSKLVRRALDNKNLAEKVSSRDDIPPELYEYLVLRATEKVKKHLVATCKPAMRQRIETLLTRVSYHVIKEGSNPPQPATGSFGVTMPKRDLGGLRTQLDGFIAANDTGEIVQTLAKLATIPAEIVKNVMRQGAEDGLLIICKAGYVGWPAVKALLHSPAWPGAPRETDIRNISDRYFRLSGESAERVLLFMKARKAMPAAEMSKLLAKA
jgi:uncharacterized protein (DUF2336 family)